MENLLLLGVLLVLGLVGGVALLLRLVALGVVVGVVLVVFHHLLAVVLSQLVGDVVEEVAPRYDWEVEVLFTEFACHLEIGEPDEEVQVSVEVVIL